MNLAKLLWKSEQWDGRLNWVLCFLPGFVVQSCYGEWNGMNERWVKEDNEMNDHRPGGERGEHLRPWWVDTVSLTVLFLTKWSKFDWEISVWDCFLNYLNAEIDYVWEISTKNENNLFGPLKCVLCRGFYWLRILLKLVWPRYVRIWLTEIDIV